MFRSTKFFWNGNTGFQELTNFGPADMNIIVTAINKKDVIHVQSDRTNRVLPFQFFDIIKNSIDGETIGWEFRSYEDNTFYTIKIVND